MFPIGKYLMQENTINIMVRFINKPHWLQQTAQSQGELTSNKAQERFTIFQGSVTYRIIQTNVSGYLHCYLGSISSSQLIHFHSFILVLYLHDSNFLYHTSLKKLHMCSLQRLLSQRGVQKWINIYRKTKIEKKILRNIIMTKLTSHWLHFH